MGYQEQAKEQKRNYPVSWDMINQDLRNLGDPNIDYTSFSQQFDSEDITGPLHNILGNTSSFDDSGILFKFKTEPSLSQPSIDPEHSKVRQMANRELKRKK